MKVFKDDDSGEFMIVRIIVGAVLLLFTYYGFIEKQPCDLDGEFLSCNLTGTWGDWVGVPLFYLCGLVLAGVPKLFGIEWFNPEGGSYYWVVFVAGALGILSFWFF